MTLPFVGRAAESQDLHLALDEVRRGQTVAVFVGGEAGVGKSRLISEFTSDLDERGVTVLRGACLDVGEDAPLWPITDAIGRLLQGPQAAWATSLLRPWEDHIRQLLTPSRSGSASGSGLSSLDLLLHVVVALSEKQPVVLCLEDLQWADRSTRNLLVFLLANLSAEQVMLICSYRLDALSGVHPFRKLLVELRRNRRSRFIDLKPLGRSDVDQLAAAVLGAGAAERVDLVWSRGGGHPLYTEEFLYALSHGDVTEVPQTLRELLLNQVDLLPPAAQEVVRVVATGFEPVGHAVLADVADLPDEELIPAVRAAVDGLVLSVDRNSQGYRLRHGFFRDVVESELLPGEGSTLQRRHALALERRPERDHAHLARLAHHWQRSGDAPRALAALIAAAEEAERLNGFAEAFSHWSAALDLRELVPDAPPAPQLIERAAETAHMSGNHDEAVRLLRQHIAASAGARVGERRRLLALSASYLLAAGQVRDAVAEYEQAAELPVQGQADEKAKADVLAGLSEALLTAGRYADARAMAEQALATGRTSGPAVRALITLGVSKAALEDHDAGVEDLRESLRRAERLQHREEIGQAYVRLAEVLAGPVNEPDEGVAVAREGAALLTRRGLDRTFGVHLLAIAANGLFRLGRWDEADQVISDALSRKPSGYEAIEARLARCRLLVGQGQLEPAAMELEGLDALTAEVVGPRYRTPLLTLRAGLEMWRRNYAEAREAIDRGLSAAAVDSDDVWLLAPLVWHGLRVEAEASREAPRPARDVQQRVEWLRAYVTQMADRAPASPAVRRNVRGYVALCEGELSRVAGASDAEVWGRAASAWQQQRHPYPAAYAMLREADALFGMRSRNARAAERLQQAARAAERLGAQPLLDECAELATRARVRLEEEPVTAPAEDAAPPSPLSSLTPREAEVLALLAGGHTNREIGRRLFMAEKTASVHVTHILHKLGVSSRVQATAYYVRSR